MPIPLRTSSPATELDRLESDIRASVQAEDFAACQALLDQYRETIEQVVRTATDPQRECSVLGPRAKDLYAWIRQMTMIGRAKYLTRLQNVRNADVYSSGRHGAGPEGTFRLKA